MSQNLHSPPKTNGRNQKNPAVEKENHVGKHCQTSIFGVPSSFFQGVSYKVETRDPQTFNPNGSKAGARPRGFLFWGSKSL